MPPLPGEDTSRQEQALAAARSDLRDALTQLMVAAKRSIPTALRNPDLDEVFAAFQAVRRTEEACDLAALDLATAQGEDA